MTWCKHERQGYQYLFLGTIADNAADMVRKGRHRPGGHLPRTLAAEREHFKPLAGKEG